MVTTALLTSSTELALSGAHQDGTRSIYAMDDALGRFLGNKARLAGLEPAKDSLFPVAKDSSVAGAYIAVSRLRNQVDTLPGDTVFQQQTYSVVSAPSKGRGRSAGVLVETIRKSRLFTVDVNSGMTVGGTLNVAGSSQISDGRDDTNCDSTAAPNAVQVSEGSEINIIGNNAKIVGTADTATYDKTEMVSLLLGGMSLQEAARLAKIKLGPGTLERAKSYDANGPRPDTMKYNWGCPRNSGDACVTQAKNDTIDNTNYYPSVAIDAGGGTVTLNGDHGQGVLIVHNGSLSIQGNFIYEGILLVERDLSIRGTAGSQTSTKIEGAVLALGESSTIEDNVSGNAVITYNRCRINEARKAFNDQRLEFLPQIFRNTGHSWFEVIR